MSLGSEMIEDTKRVELNGDADLIEVADAVGADKSPRVLERDGKAIAVVVSVEDFDRLALVSPSPEAVRESLAAAGAWADLDIDGNDLVEKIYRWRHESPT